MSSEVNIDGSLGEGGGQVLRTSLAFSAITGRELLMFNIRAGRKRPGLASQHLAGIRLISEICHAEVNGAELGSGRLRFGPNEIVHGDYRADVGTAGSITLVLQTVLPVLASVKGKSKITLTGGTDVRWAPPVDYYRLVLFPLLEKAGVNCKIEILDRGYYPRGGGKAIFTIESHGLKPLELEPENGSQQILGIINTTGLPNYVAERAGSEVLDIFPEAMLHIEHRKHKEKGMGIVLAANYHNIILGSDSLGERGKSAEKVGREATEYLRKEAESGASVDIFASDQLLPYLAIAGGSFTARKLTGHAETNIQTIESFLGKTFRVRQEENIFISRI